MTHIQAHKMIHIKIDIILNKPDRFYTNVHPMQGSWATQSKGLLCRVVWV